MQLHPLRLVSIITERVLKEQILQKCVEAGATGYTYRDVSGFGSRGLRHGFGGENIQIEIVCGEKVAEAILTFMSHDYFENYACVAWLSDVSVVRGAHYVKK